jgi:hypothetical protein
MHDQAFETVPMGSRTASADSVPTGRFAAVIRTQVDLRPPDSCRLIYSALCQCGPPQAFLRIMRRAFLFFDKSHLTYLM